MVISHTLKRNLKILNYFSNETCYKYKYMMFISGGIRGMLMEY